MAPLTFAEQLRAVLAEIEAMLVAKNAAYGNSALEPVRIFSKADPIEQLKVRLDDKLSRLMKGQAAGEDVELDLIGYLVILRMARKANSDVRVANDSTDEQRQAGDDFVAYCTCSDCVEVRRRDGLDKPRERVKAGSAHERWNGA